MTTPNETTLKPICRTLFGGVASGTGAGGVSLRTKVVLEPPSCATKKPIGMPLPSVTLTGSAASKSSTTGSVAASVVGTAPNDPKLANRLMVHTRKSARTRRDDIRASLARYVPDDRVSSIGEASGPGVDARASL